MPNGVPESDWKLFRALRVVALERFCERVLKEVAELAAAPDKSFHVRYADVYRQIHSRDEELALAFDDMRRSMRVAQLVHMRRLRLIEDEELAKFSTRAREVVALLAERHDPSQAREDS